MNSRDVLTLALCCALAACASSNKEKEKPKEEQAPPEPLWCEAPPPWARAMPQQEEPKKQPDPAKPAAPAKPAPEPAKPSPAAAAPAPAKATTTVEKPAPSPSRTVDATGQDWAKQMGDVGFTFDVDAAAKRAVENGRPMMLYFTNPACAACKELGGTAFKDARVVAKSKAFEPVLVNVSRSKDLAAKYGIATTPTIVYAVPGGSAVAKTIDVVAPAEALADMDGALAALAKSAASPK
jgi:thiol-disulfide isomerase/thioredoxin